MRCFKFRTYLECRIEVQRVFLKWPFSAKAIQKVPYSVGCCICISADWFKSMFFHTESTVKNYFRILKVSLKGPRHIVDRDIVYPRYNWPRSNGPNTWFYLDRYIVIFIAIYYPCVMYNYFEDKLYSSSRWGFPIVG